MGQTIPIVLTPINCPYGFSGLTINQLITLITQFISAEISLNTVSFFQQGTVDPTSNIGVFYNSAQQLFKGWDNGTGRYLPIGLSVQAGDTKVSFVAGDEPQQGWVVLDGRLLTAVTGISQNQLTVLQILFGTATNANLPNWTAIGSYVGLPPTGSFSGITIPTWAPPNNQIAALPFSSPPMQTEVQALAQNTEQASDSGSALTAAIIQLQAQSEALLDAMNATNSENGSSAPAYAKIYVGSP